MDETIDAPTQALDLGRCLNEAVDVWKKNWLVLALAALVVMSVSTFTVGILAGPLAGGVAVMTLQALRRDDKTVVLGDMFRDFTPVRAFDKLLPLVGLFFIWMASIIVGTALCVVPGLIVMTIWLFCYSLVVDHDLGIFASLRVSKDIVMYKGFWTNLVLALIWVGIEIVTLTPYVGFIIGCFLVPIGWLSMASAYIQLVDEDSGLVQNLIKAELECAKVGV